MSQVPIGLYIPPDGVTNPQYKLLHFSMITLFCKEKKTLAFNWDRCCHLALCLQLILFHFQQKFLFFGTKMYLLKTAIRLKQSTIFNWTCLPFQSCPLQAFCIRHRCPVPFKVGCAIKSFNTLYRNCYCIRTFGLSGR